MLRQPRQERLVVSFNIVSSIPQVLKILYGIAGGGRDCDEAAPTRAIITRLIFPGIGKTLAQTHNKGGRYRSLLKSHWRHPGSPIWSHGIYIPSGSSRGGEIIVTESASENVYQGRAAFTFIFPSGQRTSSSGEERQLPL